MFNKHFFFLLILSFIGGGCASSGRVFDYTAPQAPRFASEQTNRAGLKSADSLKVITYNIKFAEKVDVAIDLLESDNYLKNADIIFLQEMDGQGVERIAQTLDYNYVYYPTSRHPYHEKDFGNAILSKWPIIDDEKIIFGPSAYVSRQRVAVRARVNANGRAVELVNVHMHVKIKPQERAKRLKRLIDAVSDHTDYVIIAGDFNTYWPRESAYVQNTLINAGFTWASQAVPWTFKHWVFLNKEYVLDYIFTRGFAVIETGAIEDQTASDHIPVWSILE